MRCIGLFPDGNDLKSTSSQGPDISSEITRHFSGFVIRKMEISVNSRRGGLPLRRVSCLKDHPTPSQQRCLPPENIQKDIHFNENHNIYRQYHHHHHHHHEIKWLADEIHKLCWMSELSTEIVDTAGKPSSMLENNIKK